MSREIKFRAKRLDNNQWVIGYYLPTQYGEKHFIYFALEFLNEHTRIEIDPKTLGQFTGLKDKNGKEIYEGDIIIKTSFYDLMTNINSQEMHSFISKSNEIFNNMLQQDSYVGDYQIGNFLIKINNLKDINIENLNPKPYQINNVDNFKFI